MTNIVRFDDLDNAEIRVTDDGRYSVFDVIKFCGKKNPRDAWRQLCYTFPALLGTPTHKFLGQGSRKTPVLSFEVVSWITRYLVGDDRDHQELLKDCPSFLTRKGSHISEAVFRDALKDFYIQCGEQAYTEHRCSVGVADIVTNTTVVEVKIASSWKSAIGQAVAYSSCLDLFPEIALYGYSQKIGFEMILDTCTKMNIACSIWDISNGDAFNFLYGKGGWTMTNKDVLTKNILLRRQSALC